MTSLLPHTRTPAGPDAESGADDVTVSIPPDAEQPDAKAAARSRRPSRLWWVGLLGGATAAAVPLVLLMMAGVAGWFLSDAGAHGQPRDGLRVGALVWLLGHGSGVSVSGVPITAMPLGITLLCLWCGWRAGLRVGESVSGHGPDAAAVGDGHRDLAVPAAVTAFAAAYLVVVGLVLRLATDAGTGVSVGRTLAVALVVCVVVAGSGIAIGSGRAAIWLPSVPRWVRASLASGAATLCAFLALSALVLVVSLGKDFGTAANVLSRLHIEAGEASLYTAAMVAALPNATAFTGAFLLGPGFTLGTGTVVSTSVVALGPVPAVPLLAALPAEGVPAGWVGALTSLPALLAVGVAILGQRRHPTPRYLDGAVHGLGGGLVAGVLFGAVAAVSGGAIGPGRMAHVAPYAFEAMLHGMAAFGLGGVLGGLIGAWWTRRQLLLDDEPADHAE